jgi:effector-binding domain-containing protein
MKKKIIIASCVLLAAFILYAVFVPNIYQKEIKVNSSLSLATAQITTLTNIAKWYLPFANSDTSGTKITRDKIENSGYSLGLSKNTGLSVWYKVGEDGRSKDIVFSVMADTARSTKIILSYACTLWDKMFGSGTILKNADESLSNLKDYFGDTKKMYGYQIEVTTVTDTAFLFTSAVVAKNIKKEAFKNLYESLVRHAAENNMGYTGVRIFYTAPYGNDSIHLFTSIGITNTSPAGFNEKFSLKKMPFNGRLLSAYYQGSFGNLRNVIKSLSDFESDHAMTAMAIPFVKLITEGTDFDDNQVIQARAFIPIN